MYVLVNATVLGEQIQPQVYSVCTSTLQCWASKYSRRYTVYVLVNATVLGEQIQPQVYSVCTSKRYSVGRANTAAGIQCMY